MGGTPKVICKNCGKETTRAIHIHICRHCNEDYRYSKSDNKQVTVKKVF